MKGFKTFLLRGNILDLAVAVVMGVAFNAVVQSLVKDMITPLISGLVGKPSFGNLTVSIGKATFSYGLFLNALISFVLLAAVVYFVIVAPVSKVMSMTQRKKAATQRECPECLSLVPVEAKRCMYCTSALPPVADDTARTPEPVG